MTSTSRLDSLTDAQLREQHNKYLAQALEASTALRHVLTEIMDTEVCGTDLSDWQELLASHRHQWDRLPNHLKIVKSASEALEKRSPRHVLDSLKEIAGKHLPPNMAGVGRIEVRTHAPGLHTYSMEITGKENCEYVREHWDGSGFSTDPGEHMQGVAVLTLDPPHTFLDEQKRVAPGR